MESLVAPLGSRNEWMTSLHVSLLGGFQLRDGAGREIAIPGTKAGLLLAYLALRPGEGQPRDRLIGLLWSDRQDSQARGSLRQAIWALRRALGGIEPFPLVVKGETLWLEKDAVETDVGQLQKLAAESSADSLKTLAETCRGRLLEGLRVRDPNFEAFLRSEQARIQDLVVEAYTRCLENHPGEDSDDTLAAMAKGLLEVDPLQEVAHRALIRHHARRGQIGLAIKQYESCRDILRQELNADPSAETNALIEDVKRAPTPAAGRSGDEGDADSEAHPKGHPLTWMEEKPSIAVLPFANMSGDPEQAYFSDGLTEDIITALALWRSFPVISASSSFAYKNKAVDVKQVGRELAAPYVLEGSVRKSGRRVRITAQLIETVSGHHLWVEKFDRNLEDVFAVQDEITERIAATLELALGQVEFIRSKTKPPRSLDAWDFCLRGRSDLRDWTKAGTAEARRMFERAIEIDPNYSEAFADLAWTHSRDLLMECTDDRPASMDKMYQAARRAVELDDASWRAR